MKKITALLCALVFVAAGCELPGASDSTNTNSATNTNSSSSEEMEDKSTKDMMMESEPTSDDSSVEMTTEEKDEMKTVSYDYKGTLDPVDGGNGTGTAMAVFKDGKYMMLAEIENIPDPEEGFFYEGWVVRKEPFNFISTGELEKVDGKWVNNYMSEEDLTDHFRYVLTIEPRDNDPAPADHVVEGDMMKVNN